MTTSDLARAVIAELDDDALAELAARLAPYLPTAAPADDGWLRGADQIASYIGCPRSRVYALSSAGRLAAVEHDGKTLVARRSQLDAWMHNGGGKRP